MIADHPVAIGVMTASLSLLAQVADGQPAGIPGVVTTMTSTGVLIWYLWFSTCRLVPSLISRFEEQLNAIRETFERQMQAERDHCREEMASLREVAELNMRALLKSSETSIADVSRRQRES